MKHLKEILTLLLLALFIAGSAVVPAKYLSSKQHQSPIDIFHFFFPQTQEPFVSVTNRNSIQESADELISKVTKTSFALYGQSKNVTLFLCTVTAYEKIPGGYLLLSAGHCFEDNPDDVIYSVAEDLDQPHQPVKVVKWLRNKKTNLDFAVLELTTDKEYPVLGLDVTASAAVGDELITVHFADDIGKQFTQVYISSRIINYPTECGVCRDNFYVSAAGLGAGSSGAALVSKKTGKIVGIVVGFVDNLFIAEPISRFSVFVVSK